MELYPYEGTLSQAALDAFGAPNSAYGWLGNLWDKIKDIFDGDGGDFCDCEAVKTAANQRCMAIGGVMTDFSCTPDTCPEFTRTCTTGVIIETREVEQR
jgi:hypothetical protein